VLTFLLGVAVVCAMGAAVFAWQATAPYRRPGRAPLPKRPAGAFTPLTPEQLAEVDAYDWSAAERDLTGRTGRHAPPEQP
jgi:hypothetical protein